MKNKYFFLLLQIFFCTKLLGIANNSVFSQYHFIVGLEHQDSESLRKWNHFWQECETLNIKSTLVLISHDESFHISPNIKTNNILLFKSIPDITIPPHYIICPLSASLFPNDICITTDINNLPNLDKFFLNLSPKINTNFFTVIQDSQFKKYNILFLIGFGSLFKEVFQIHSFEDIQKRMIALKQFKLIWSEEELELYHSSVELILFRYIWNHPVGIKKQSPKLLSIPHSTVLQT